MAKRIAYTIVDNGVDGRAPTHIVSAFWDEDARDDAFESNANKNYYRKDEMIINVEAQAKASLAKLDGLDRLLLSLEKV